MGSLSRWFTERRLRQAWGQAIARCRRSPWSGKFATKRFAILTIRMFECINRVTFDPFDSRHVDCVAGMASHTELFERLHHIWGTRIHGR